MKFNLLVMGMLAGLVISQPIREDPCNPGAGCDGTITEDPPISTDGTVTEPGTGDTTTTKGKGKSGGGGTTDSSRKGNGNNLREMVTILEAALAEETTFVR